MININLLPLDRQKKKFPLSKFYLWIAYACLIIVLLLWMGNLAMLKYTESKYKATNDAYSAMTMWQERYAMYEAQNAEIGRRASIIKTLDGQRMLWSGYLAELGNVTPYGCWLISVTQNPQAPQSIGITGRALKMSNLLEFIHNLQQDPQVASVSLEDSKLVPLPQTAVGEVTEFNITVVRQGGAPNAGK